MVPSIIAYGTELHIVPEHTPAWLYRVYRGMYEPVLM